MKRILLIPASLFALVSCVEEVQTLGTGRADSGTTGDEASSHSRVGPEGSAPHPRPTVEAGPVKSTHDGGLGDDDAQPESDGPVQNTQDGNVASNDAQVGSDVLVAPIDASNEANTCAVAPLCDGGVCPGSSCSPLVSRTQSPAFVAVDSTNLYWTGTDIIDNGGTGLNTIMKVPIGGGAPVTLATTAAPQGFPGNPLENNVPVGIAVDGTNLYSFDQVSASVIKVAIAGGAATTLATGDAASYHLAINGKNVYWPGSSGIMKVPALGGTPTTLATTENVVGDIAADSENVYWTTWGESGTVMQVPSTGGTPITLVANSPQGFDWNAPIAISSTHVYWWTSNIGAGGGTGPLIANVMSVPIGGGAPTTIAAGEYVVNGLATDSTSVYWSAHVLQPSMTADHIARAPLLGGAGSTVLAHPFDGNVPLGIAVDATSVYWADYAQDNLMKLAPK